MTKKIFAKANRLFSLADKLVKTHQVQIILALHEYFRNLYLEDPFVKKNKLPKKTITPLNKINITLDNCIRYLETVKNFGYYPEKKKTKKYILTKKLFGVLWKDRFKDNKINSSKILDEFYKNNKSHLIFIKNKKVLDMGCGSGRFSFALAKKGAKKVIGVDLGEDGLKVAKKYKKLSGVKNVEFRKSSVLKLPFKNSSFDYVFCKGVLHHTGNLKKGLNEFHRVLKKGGKGFIYLYGSGGLYWYSRKKMRSIMKKIEFNLSKNILDFINIPSRRTIFLDSWYVEIEDHVSKISLEKWFEKKNFLFKKIKTNKNTHLESYEKFKHFKLLYGNGELRYLIEKL